MLSVANQNLVDRERELVGLATLLDAKRTADELFRCELPLDGALHIHYLRYKPGRRCISLVSTSIAGTEQKFVLTAFPALDYRKQRARTLAAAAEGMCWQDSAKRIRIDRFPFDSGLRHIAKCFDSGERSRLLRRILGRDNAHARMHLETLAYKPSRRYVAAGKVAYGCAANAKDSTRPSKFEALITLKFYSPSQFSQTLKRLQSVGEAYSTAPRTVASHEHYKVIAMEWIQGQLLANYIASGHDLESLFFEVGAELARLHHCVPARDAPAAAAAHPLDNIASYIGFISPDLAELANHAVKATLGRLAELRQPLTLIHGDFYAKQVLVDLDAVHESVRFIDFDQAGLGNPYQDLGNFVAKLYWQRLLLGQELSAVQDLAEPFLCGYRGVTRSFDEYAYRVHLSASLIRCATHPFRRALVDWPDATRQLLWLAHSVLPQTQSMPSPVTIA